MTKPLPIIIVLGLIVVGFVVYFVFVRDKGPQMTTEFSAIAEKAKVSDTSAAEGDTAPWEQDIPAGTKLVEKDAAPPKLNVVAARRDEGAHSLLEFEISEEHGYMVDGILLEFWYRKKNEETGEWVKDSKRVGFFIKQRLGFNETIVDSTPLLDIEFEHLGIDLAATTTENWQARVVNYTRAMVPDKS